MGTQLFDQYSLLHFASGVVAYFWGVPFIAWVILHAIFEAAENTATGMRIINSFPVWPGGKSLADTPANILGDNIASILGWLAAALLDWYMGDPYQSLVGKN